MIWEAFYEQRFKNDDKRSTEILYLQAKSYNTSHVCGVDGKRG